MDADRHNAYYGLVPLNITFQGAVQWILDHKIIGRHPGCRDETGNDDIGGESMFSPPTLAGAHLDTSGQEMEVVM